MKKIDANKMMLKNLDFMSKYGITGIQIGNTTFRKKGKSTLEITKQVRVRKNKD